MQTKFITLALSALLALSTVNALPAGTPAEGSSTDVQKTAGQDVAATKNTPAATSNKNGIHEGLVEGLVADVGDLLVEVGKLVEAVGNLLAGKPYDKGLNVSAVLEAVLKLLDLKAGEGLTSHNKPTGPAATPEDDQPLTFVIVFIDNIKSGHSGYDAANGNPAGLLTAVLALLGEVLGLVL
ncbi:hypothetical protein BJV82DRAFT_598559 [Fennellomyces sp. T-0311]|nr:hypothetical protein BJV82DRAFT_598559 [Fennellomyces sp. T-0311]